MSATRDVYKRQVSIMCPNILNNLFGDLVPYEQLVEGLLKCLGKWENTYTWVDLSMITKYLLQTLWIIKFLMWTLWTYMVIVDSKRTS